MTRSRNGSLSLRRMPARCHQSDAPPNKRLKLAGGDRFEGSGVLCPWRGTDCRPTALRRRASRPQLKRDPLDGAGTPSMITLHLDNQIKADATIQDVEAAVLSLDGEQRTLILVELPSGQTLTIGGGPDRFVAEVTES